MTEPRFVWCENCQGEGRILLQDGRDPDGTPRERDEGPCPYCDGTCYEEVETDLVCANDLNDAWAAGQAVEQ